MTKEFCKIMLLAGTILCSGISAVNAQTCSTPPSCEALGYTKAKDDCKGIQSLQCPFDTSKYYCFSVAELPPEYNAQGEIAVGAILYSDGTIYKSVKPGKEPIAIVFDVENRLAVALLDQLPSVLRLVGREVIIPGLVNEYRPISSCRIKCLTGAIETRPTGEKHCSVSLSLSIFDSNVISFTPFTENGRDNTRIISDYCKAQGISCPGIDFINNYKTAGTSAGQWFIPSIREILTALDNAGQFNAIAKSLGKQLVLSNNLTSSSDGRGGYLETQIFTPRCNSNSYQFIEEDGYMNGIVSDNISNALRGYITPVIKF